MPGQALACQPSVILDALMAMTNRELSDVLMYSLAPLLLSLGGFLAWNGLWAVGLPLMLATIGSAIWYGRRRARQEEDEAIARAAEYDADERGRADETR